MVRKQMSQYKIWCFSVKWRNEIIDGISVESGIAIKISLWEPFWAETQMMWNCKPSKIDPEMFQAEGQQLWISGDKTSTRCTGNRKWGRLVSDEVKDAGGAAWLPSSGAPQVRLGGWIHSGRDFNIQKPGTESQASLAVGWCVTWDSLKYSRELNRWKNG